MPFRRSSAARWRAKRRRLRVTAGVHFGFHQNLKKNRQAILLPMQAEHIVRAKDQAELLRDAS
ncbi:hypothetical protein VST7929_01142 [Vibrio stylophorae]|uniref:Uncharacterized protein n=1 Tax=Vibrio stylophorae TaxID=659351 RepID=A0ABN8DTX8_9VIBR|nr:hypothetical protein [Vibrio stylophorae]CAH0533278.1 hypothetical protein VST7929_01142 [Vibrio stylophorae]